jgi:hypothetical protein
MAEKLDVKQGTLALMIPKTLEVLGPLHGYGVARHIEETSKTVSPSTTAPSTPPSSSSSRREGWRSAGLPSTVERRTRWREPPLLRPGGPRFPQRGAGAWWYRGILSLQLHPPGRRRRGPDRRRPGHRLRVLRSGALTRAARLARHLWRMSFALLIATMSFFLGQAKGIPSPIRIPALLALPVLAVLVTMLYWLWRVRIRQWLGGLGVTRVPQSRGEFPHRLVPSAGRRGSTPSPSASPRSP